MSSLFGSANSASGVNQTTTVDISGDLEIPQGPEDSVSDIAFSPTAEILSVASWDNKIRIYEIGQGGANGKAMYEHTAPVLSTHFSKDGSKLASGSADKTAKVFDLASGQHQQVAAHEMPIKSVKFISVNGSEALATASWDKTLKYWDLRQPTPIATVNLPERAYSMDTKDNLLVVGTADRQVSIFNLSNPTVMYKTLLSPLKYQTRVVSCFTTGNGFAVGSVEGRCAIQYVEDKDSSLNFSFRCHRDTPTTNQRDPINVYSVNAISFHPQHGTFSTAGSDGSFHFWDKDSKHRLKGCGPGGVGGTISCTAFSGSGQIFAYAVSYDWSKGYQHNNPTLPNKIMLHPLKDDEMKPKARKR